MATFAIVDGPTIAAGESLSDGIDCTSGNIARITVPQEFTDANLSFQVSSDGNFYNDMYDSRGDEITISAKANTGIVVSGDWVRTIAFIKFRSGTREHPVQQKQDCRFAVALRTDAVAGS
jgi:hypothetical protein